MKGLPHAIATGDPQNSTPESITQNDKVKEKRLLPGAPKTVPQENLGVPVLLALHLTVHMTFLCMDTSPESYFNELLPSLTELIIILKVLKIFKVKLHKNVSHALVICPYNLCCM